jgi:hypothetical protein
MNGKAFSLAAGFLWGFLLFVFTLLETARGSGKALAHLVAVYPGYSVTYVGSVIGLVYGFISAALVGAVFCGLYTLLCGRPKGTSA